MQHSSKYVIGFAGAVCLVCAVVVAGSAVLLKPRQEANKVVDRQSKILTVSGVIEEGESLTVARAQELFDANIKARVIDLETGAYDDTVDATTYDQRKAASDPALSEAAPDNAAGVSRLPKHALVYHLVKGGQVEMLILPIEGKGLWSTMRGYLALAPDANTVRGITFYEHGETPGLGGEIDNPRWKALWVGRKVFGDDDAPALHVIKGAAGSPQDAPYRVDGLSGATLTGNGVTNTLAFWLSSSGYGPYLDRFRQDNGGES